MKLFKKYPFTILSILLSFLIISYINLAGNVLSAPANHIVISEVQVYGTSSGEDFIELYNPTDTAIDLANYRLVKRTSSGMTDSNIVSFQSGDEIPAHGFFLWCNNSISESLNCDRSTSQTVSNNNSIGLRDGEVDTGTLVDSVTLGSPSYPLGEETFIGLGPAQVPGSNESIERKACPNSTYSSMTNGDSSSGNSEDSDDNSADFINKTTPEPQNSLGPLEAPNCSGEPTSTPPLEPSPTETPTNTPSPTDTPMETPTTTPSTTPTTEPTTTPTQEPSPTTSPTPTVLPSPTPTNIPTPNPTSSGKIIGRFIFPGYVKTCRLTIKPRKLGFFLYFIPRITCN